MIGLRRLAALCVCAAALLGRPAWGDAFDPPAGYYSTATATGAALKSQLNSIVKTGVTPVSYDTARSALQITDADPNNPGYILLVYNRASVDLAAIIPTNPPNIFGWDGGITWNREHTWPISRGLGSESIPDGSDLHNLRPANPSINTQRGNRNFGGAFGAQPFGVVSDFGPGMWYPGDADAGMIARQEFYMATRYDGTEAGTTNLELAAGNPADNTLTLGDLNRLIEWHFAAPPDSFERRRNQVIYDTYQHNRNPFIDGPEFAWSVIMNDANDSQISIGGSPVDASGGSVRNVDLGRMLVGAALPEPQAFSLNKAGNNGTYFEVTASGAATSSLGGRYNAFRSSQTDSKSIDVGLSTNTTAAGLSSGTVTIDNLDVTTGGGSGRGANDANDVFNVSLAVLDHATPSFAAGSELAMLTHDFGDVPRGTSGVDYAFDLFNLVATVGFTSDMDFDSVAAAGDSSILTTNLAAAAGSLTLPAGAGQAFAAMFNTAATGSYSATYTLMFSDENLPGAIAKTLMLTLVGNVLDRIAGDYNENGVVDAADYAVWRHAMGQSVTAFSGADGDGDGVVDDDDYHVWRAHFGEVAAATGAAVVVVPEPGGISLASVLFAAALGGHRPRRHAQRAPLTTA